MKKGLLIIVAGVVLILAVACGTPYGMDAKTYEYGEKALEIIQKYNSADISAEDAMDRLQDIETSLDNLEIEDDLKDITNDSVQMTVNSAILDLQYDFGTMLEVENRLKDQLEK